MRRKGTYRNRRSRGELRAPESENRAGSRHFRVGRICPGAAQGRLHFLVYGRAVLFPEIDTVSSGPKERRGTKISLPGLAHQQKSDAPAGQSSGLKKEIGRASCRERV